MTRAIGCGFYLMEQASFNPSAASWGGEIAPSLAFGLPLASLAITMASPLLGYDRWSRLIHSESGFVELGTVVLCVVAVTLTALIVRRHHVLPRPVTLCASLLGAAAFLFLGEEISWGQHLFGWNTPDYWREINRQGETNLHNLGYAFNQLPRGVLSALCAIGGIVLPLLCHGRFERLDTVAAWLVPDRRLIPVSVLAALGTVPKRLLQLGDWLEEGTFWELALPRSEVKEYFIAMALTMYLWCLHVRVRRSESARMTAVAP